MLRSPGSAADLSRWVRIMKLLEAYARFMFGKLSSDEIVAVANTWINDGVYSDSLGELCTIASPKMSDVGPLFESAMQELKVTRPSRLESAFILTNETVHRIAQGELDPVEGSEFLYWQVHHEISSEFPDKQYVGDNLGLEQVFCWLREIWDCRDGSMILNHTDLPRDQTEKKFIEHLVEAAKEWNDKVHPTMPRTLPLTRGGPKDREG